eukprot:scaffold8923_cov67-Phaeocystis_antarctica.AAC.3
MLDVPSAAVGVCWGLSLFYLDVPSAAPCEVCFSTFSQLPVVPKAKRPHVALSGFSCLYAPGTPTLGPYQPITPSPRP